MNGNTASVATGDTLRGGFVWLCGLPAVSVCRKSVHAVRGGFSWLRCGSRQPQQQWFLSHAELPDAWESPADNSMVCLELVKEKIGSPTSESSQDLEEGSYPQNLWGKGHCRAQSPGMDASLPVGAN